MSYVYHYTDADGANGILNSGYIGKSSKFNAAFGEGVYFTELTPTSERDHLVVNNYDDGKKMVRRNLNRTDFYFAIKKSSLPGLQPCNSRSGRNVWLNPQAIDLGKVEFIFGATPDTRELSSYANVRRDIKTVLRSLDPTYDEDYY